MHTLAQVAGKGEYGLGASSTLDVIGPKFLRTTDMISGTIDWAKVPYCQVTTQQASKYLLNHGDLVISRTGANAGAAAYVSNPPLSAVFAGYLVRFTVNPSIADSRFVSYVLQSDLWAEYVDNARTGSAQPQLNAVLMGEFQFPLPPLEEQQSIASTLGYIDDLIALNESLARKCDLLAEALWQRAATLSIVDRRLADCSEITLGGTPSRSRKEFWGGTIPWLNSGKANDFRVVDASELITSEGLASSSTKLMKPGTTLLAITGATLGQVSRLEIEACGNQSLIGVFNVDEIENDYLFFAVRDRIHVLMQSATGGAQQHVNRGNVEDLEIQWLPVAEMQKWHRIVKPLLHSSAQLLFESMSLRNARAALLPELLTGTISAPGGKS